MSTSISLNYMSNKNALLITGVVSCVVVTGTAFGITAPTAAGSPLGYDLYDVAVNDMLKGPAGFVGGLGAIVYGVSQLAKSWMIAALSVLGGSAIIKADTIVASLGAII